MRGLRGGLVAPNAAASHNHNGRLARRGTLWEASLWALYEEAYYAVTTRGSLEGPAMSISNAIGY